MLVAQRMPVMDCRRIVSTRQSTARNAMMMRSYGWRRSPRMAACPMRISTPPHVA